LGARVARKIPKKTKECEDIRLIFLAVQAEALDKLGPLAKRIALIFVPADPQRDTPDRLKSYLATFKAKPPSARSDFIALTGTTKLPAWRAPTAPQDVIDWCADYAADPG